QHLERLALGVADDPGLAPAQVLTVGIVPGPDPDVAEHAERIIRHIGMQARRMRAPGRLAAVHAHFPGRAMTGDRVLLVFEDRVVAHAGEEIVRVVVLAHVAETEPPMLVLALPPLGGAMRGRRLAAWPLAGRQIDARPAILVGLHSDAVDHRRGGFHAGTIMRTRRSRLQALTNWIDRLRRSRFWHDSHSPILMTPIHRSYSTLVISPF